MFVSAIAKTELDFEAVAADLRRSFPSLTVLSDDYYAARLAEYRRIAREIGLPAACAPIRCFERNAAEHEVCRHLSVVVPGGIAFNTRIDKLGIWAMTHDPNDISDADPILAILQRYPLAITTSYSLQAFNIFFQPRHANAFQLCQHGQALVQFAALQTASASFGAVTQEPSGVKLAFPNRSL